MPKSPNVIFVEPDGFSLSGPQNIRQEGLLVPQTIVLQGVPGPVGPAGSQGPVGAQGLEGPQGAQGNPGAGGIQGAQGPTGSQGATGSQGIAGPQGETGAQGPPGATGPQGPAGSGASTSEENIWTALQIFSDGLTIPQLTDCSTSTAEASICWDSDENALIIGTGLDTDLLLSDTNYSGVLDNVYLQVANNLDDLTSVTTARSNLGLGTLAIQNANNVNLSGGVINGITIGGTAPGSGSFTTLAANSTLTTGGNIAVTKTNPSLVLNSLTVGDTNYWIGIQNDGQGDDDDVFQIGKGINPGTGAAITLGSSGSVGLGTTTINNKLEVNGAVGALKLRGTSGTPAIAVGVGAGTGGSASISGSDSAGEITLTTGTLPTGANSVVFTVTFANSYSTAPYISFVPSNATAGLLSGATHVFVTSTTTTFVFNSGTAGLTGSSTYKWHYHVIQ